VSKAPFGALVVAAVFANAVWWGAGIPFGGAPDEPDHYQMVKFVSDHGRLPHYGDPGFLVSLMASDSHAHIVDPLNRRALTSLEMRPRQVELRQTYLFVPQLPYALNGWLNRILGGASAALARGFNALCIAIVALLVFVAGCALWPQSRWAPAVAGACVGLWPQITFLGAYVNDDAFAVMSAAALMGACASCQSHSFDRRHAIALGLGIGLVGASKPYVLVLLPLALLWFWGWRRSTFAGALRSKTPRFRQRMLLALAIAAALTIPWLVRNAILYEGDPTGRRFLEREVRAFVGSLSPIVKGNAKLLFLDPPERRLTAERLGTWKDITMESFWARFGWMNLRAPRVLVVAAFVVLATGLVGSLLVRRPWWSAPWVFAIPALGLLVIGSMVNSYAIDYQPQGRYLLAAAPALVLQITGGITAIRARGVRNALLAVFLVFFVAQNLYCRLVVLQ
jgi:4-amino-4-deoxy-L-arabinose transferase-like glycosyltransferase